MRLYYWQGKPNYGDALNPWLWDRLLGTDWFDDTGSLFIGIGTVLDNRFAESGRKVVMGAGNGYQPPPKLVSDWDVQFVRGPLTASRLRLSPETALTDPAVLARRFAPRAQEPEYGLSLMLHHESLRASPVDWARLCQQAGIHLIDPANPVEQVTSDIRRSRLLVAEAMHGAVVADAFRVPWIPVTFHNHVLAFKWWDWCASLRLWYEPLTVPGIAQRLGYESQTLLARPELLVYALPEIAANHGGLLSDATRLEGLEARLLERVEAFRHRYGGPTRA